jgi:uncharacterized protein YyaL (SSP411 family)
VLERAPTAAGQSLIALDDLLAPAEEFAVIAANDLADFRLALRAIYQKFRSHKVVAPVPIEVSKELADVVPLVAGRTARRGEVTTYICKNFACLAPVVGLMALRRELRLD